MAGHFNFNFGGPDPLLGVASDYTSQFKDIEQLTRIATTITHYGSSLTQFNATLFKYTIGCYVEFMEVARKDVGYIKWFMSNPEFDITTKVTLRQYYADRKNK